LRPIILAISMLDACDLRRRTCDFQFEIGKSAIDIPDLRSPKFAIHHRLRFFRNPVL
jgi:hypothetical protein